MEHPNGIAARLAMTALSGLCATGIVACSSTDSASSTAASSAPATTAAATWVRAATESERGDYQTIIASRNDLSGSGRSGVLDFDLESGPKKLGLHTTLNTHCYGLHLGPIDETQYGVTITLTMGYLPGMTRDNCPVDAGLTNITTFAELKRPLAGRTVVVQP